MKKQFVVIGIFALLICLGLSGCEQDTTPLNTEEEKFVGTWTGNFSDFGGNELTIVFSLDGTFSIGILNGTWVIQDNSLGLAFNQSSQIKYSYTFSNNDRTLTITRVGGTTHNVLRKQ